MGDVLTLTYISTLLLLSIDMYLREGLKLLNILYLAFSSANVVSK